MWLFLLSFAFGQEPVSPTELMTLDPDVWITHGLPMAKGLAMGLLTLFITWMISKWVNRLVQRGAIKARIDPALASFLASIAQYTVLAAGVIASMSSLGVETTSVTAVFASAGIAVGLALQGSLSNFAAGVMILFFRPFSLGDVVQVAGEMGTISDIGLFATTLITPNNEKIIIPNGAITGGNITNFTAQGTRRAAVDFGVAYGCDLAETQKVVLDAVKALDIVLDEPAPATAFVEMAASSLNFKCIVWGKSEDYLAMQHEVRSAAYDALNAANIEIPFNQIVVHQAPTDA